MLVSCQCSPYPRTFTAMRDKARLLKSQYQSDGKVDVEKIKQFLDKYLNSSHLKHI